MISKVSLSISGRQAQKRSAFRYGGRLVLTAESGISERCTDVVNSLVSAAGTELIVHGLRHPHETIKE